MIITITNPRNKLSCNFLGAAEYREKYGVKSFHEKAQIAAKYNDYELYERGLSGLFALPASQGYFVEGYRQVGSDYQYNSYQNRIITFEFAQHYGEASTNQNQVFNQKGHMLEIMITTGNGIFYIHGHLNGVSERGLIEFDCPNPYFFTRYEKTGEDIYVIKKDIIEVNPTGRTLFPLTLPQIFFGAPKEKGVISVNADLATDFTITLKGIFSDIKIVNRTLDTSHTTLLYDGHVQNEMIISSADETTYVDGVDVSGVMRGLYPTLIEGQNEFEFFIADEKQITDVEVEMKYRKTLANIS